MSFQIQQLGQQRLLVASKAFLQALENKTQTSLAFEEQRQGSELKESQRIEKQPLQGSG
jgi:hypothetical protein